VAAQKNRHAVLAKWNLNETDLNNHRVTYLHTERKVRVQIWFSDATLYKFQSFVHLIVEAGKGLNMANGNVQAIVPRCQRLECLRMSACAAMKFIFYVYCSQCFRKQASPTKESLWHDLHLR
jgi:hypothetical protein